MKIESNKSVLNNLNSLPKSDEAKNNSTNSRSINNQSTSLDSDKINSIDNIVDKISSKTDSSSKVYNRFKATNETPKNMEFVRTTILKPGTYDAIDLNIHYDGVSKVDFKDVNVWKNTIGKTVYAITKTLNYVHNNSNTSFPQKIEFNENYTSKGLKNNKSFYQNLNTLAQKLSNSEINFDEMKDNIFTSIENYI